MSIIKSFSVSNGDMFYIEHGSDNFTIIDCNLSEFDTDTIIDELKKVRGRKNIARFISTHPDNDHISGIEKIFDQVGIENFYCVKNEATKSDITESFKRYCELRDSDKSFYISKGVTRRYMNLDGDEIKNSGINILWPDINNDYFKEQLERAKDGESPNNISPIIRYSLANSVTALWMGDLETDFMEGILEDVEWEEVDILFAPHHGRKSGEVPIEILNILKPKIIVIGEADSKHIHYYNLKEFKTITQNSSKDIIFDCSTNKIQVFVKEEDYEVDFLEFEIGVSKEGYHYIGTLWLN